MTAARASGDVTLIGMWNTTKQEFIIATFAPGTQLNYDAELIMNVTLDEVPKLQGIPVLELTSHFGTYAGYAINQISNELT